MNQDLKKRALAYVHVDKLSIIPVSPSKIPLIQWKEYQNRFPTDEEINSWFEKYPDMQLGIVTGKLSNLSVVDVEAGGDPSFLPQNTFIVKTGGGGWHYYYRFCEGLQNKARVKELVDIRSEGGYVVAPGSHSDKGEYTVLKRSRPIDFPKLMFPSTPVTYGPPGAFYPPKEAFHEGFETILDYEGAPSGQRNDQMARYIGKVLTRIHRNEWDTIAWQIVERANQKNIPPLSPTELQAVFRSITSREVRKPVRSFVLDDHRTSGGPFKSELDTQEPEIFEGDEIKLLYEVAESQSIQQEDTYPLGVKIFDEAILGGVSPGDLITIGGETGNGKSTLCMDWTMSFMNGEKKPKVLWFSYEMLVSHVWKKFQEMGMTKDSCALVPAKHSTGNVAWVEKKIKEAKEKFGVKIIVIDHLGFLLPKTEGVLGKSLSQNYATFLTQIVRDLKTIAIKEEVIIFLPVHLRKTGGNLDLDSIKDSSGIAQESDLVFFIQRERNKDKDSGNFYTEKTKIFMAKNRKTGQTVSGNFFMLNNRFKLDDSDERAEKEFKELGEEMKKVDKKDTPGWKKDVPDNLTIKKYNNIGNHLGFKDDVDIP